MYNLRPDPATDGKRLDETLAKSVKVSEQLGKNGDLVSLGAEVKARSAICSLPAPSRNWSGQKRISIRFLPGPQPCARG
ncbi:MAG: hypothetical protein ED859_15505 [Desulfuromonadales bacterium]|nr:MAG: hypothetical protein ED859_15505 [Desulfuromonadales bacterium]